MSGWPEVVWSAAVLRGLDERARAEIEAAGALRTVERGSVVYRVGEPADAFFVLAEGACDVRAVRRGEVEARVIRRVLRGEAFGEEATLRAGASRAMEAVASETARVAEVKVSIFRRASGRVGKGEVAAKLERTLRRSATGDLLRTMSFTRDLADRDRETLLDAIEHVYLARGEALFRTGDLATHAYFLADGMLQVQTEDEGRLRVRAYLARGDIVGDEAALAGDRHDVSAMASGPAWVLAVPRAVFADVAARRPEGLARVHRVAAGQREVEQRIVRDARTTAHVFKDLYRLDVARSLLVIDQDTCVRCGHCAWACASAHDDGIARIVRRGDKVVTELEGRGAHSTLLVPNSCQHCENPACMIDCPTGAIARDPRGEVLIREELCIGCGNCAKACPWDNIEMAPRAPAAKKRSLPLAPAKPDALVLSDTVAVKCDLCHDLAAGPACVRACPTEAITRINPKDALPALGALAGRASPTVIPLRARAWPWVMASVVAAVAMGRAPIVAGAGRLATGIAAGVLMTLLTAYVVVKRVGFGFRKRRESATKTQEPKLRSRVRPYFIAHLVLGVLVVGVVVAHAGIALPPNVAGALAIAFWAAAAAGALAGLAYRVLPERLTRIERAGALPEDLPGRSKELDERLFRELSGRTEAVKAVYARILRPYARNVLGPLMLLVRGRRLRDEEARILARIDRALEGRKSASLRGLDALVRIVVEARAVAAQRWLQRGLRAFVPVHVMAAAVAVALLVLHVVFALRTYR